MKRRRTTSANSVIESQLDARANQLEDVIGGHCLAIKAPMFAGIDDLVRETIRNRLRRRKSPKLLVVLETEGGQIEPTRRIADTLHHHYRIVEYLIPNYAMSAGTILAMSGDAIHMDEYSILGPIDPQVKVKDRWVPGLGYVEKHRELMDKAAHGKLNTAEMTWLIEKFDPAFLYQLEHERDLSITLLKEWLVKYKFKNWQRTKTQKRPVTKQMKDQRAEQVANCLNNTKLWHVHGRGIPRRVLIRTLKLEIEDFSRNDGIQVAVHEYYRLFIDYMQRRGHEFAIHRPGVYLGAGEGS